MFSFHRNTIATFLLVAPLLVSLDLINVGAIDPTYLYHVCPNTTTFTPNSTYETNRNSLLSSLSSNANREFYNASSGGMVYGLFLCRGDVNSTVCRDCVTFAVNDTIQRCRVEKGVIIWYDECLLRYNTTSFFGTVSLLPRVALLNTANITGGDQDQFNRLLNTTMKEAAAEAATGSQGAKKLGTTEARFNSFQTLYNLAQCTPDLSSADCRSCLEAAIGRLPLCCAGKLGGRVLFPSCNVRYEFYPFYSQTLLSLPPAPLPGPPPPGPPPESNGTSHKGKSKISSQTIVAIFVPVAVCLVLFMVGVFFICKRARKQYKPAVNTNAEANDITTIESLQFDLATLETATNKFSAINKLGEGGFGEVYKGILLNGQQIAVKRLSKGSGQGAAEFKNEVVLLAKLQHRNLVRLLGFCLEGEEKLLVYEFVPNKSLDYFLYEPERQGQLDWLIRHKIIAGIARGILYLHEDSQLKIIHRDLKPSNILLDGDMNPKISDFGMARMFEVDQTRGNTSKIVGTYGYMSPEYAMHGQFSVKSDVYSFGVLILEIISGKRNSSFYQSDYAEDLLSYAWKLWKEGTPLKLLDPKLGNSYSENEVVRCIHVGLLCVQEDPEDRPNMKTVVLMFNSYSIDLPVPEKPAFYDRTEGEMPTMGLKFHQSTSSGYPPSINEASITELYPR